MSNFHNINKGTNEDEKIASRAKRRRDGYFAKERRQISHNSSCSVDPYKRTNNRDAEIIKIIKEEY